MWIHEPTRQASHFNFRLGGGKQLSQDFVKSFNPQKFNFSPNLTHLEVDIKEFASTLLCKIQYFLAYHLIWGLAKIQGGGNNLLGGTVASTPSQLPPIGVPEKNRNHYCRYSGENWRSRRRREFFLSLFFELWTILFGDTWKCWKMGCRKIKLNILNLNRT